MALQKRQAKKEKLAKAISPEDLGIKIINSIDAEFRDADDRVLAVIGAAYLDSILEQLLRAIFVDNDEETRKLLDPDRPIGSNGSRCQLAFCLGLIDVEQRDDLKEIAKIRNLFAHNFDVSSFEDPVVDQEIQKLNFFKRRNQIVSELADKESTAEGKKRFLKVGLVKRDIFRDAVLQLFTILLPKIRDVRRSDSSMWYGLSERFVDQMAVQ